MNTPKSKMKQSKASLRRESESLTSDEDFIEINVMSSDDEAVLPIPRRSTRKHTPAKTFYDFVTDNSRKKSTTTSPCKRTTINEAEVIRNLSKENAAADDNEINYVKMEAKISDCRNVNKIERAKISYPIMSNLNTPKKKSMTTKIGINSPKTPTRSTATSRTNTKLTKTPSTKQLRKMITSEPKTPSHVRGRLKNEIAKMLKDTSSGTDFSSDDSDFEPTQDESCSESSTESERAGSQAFSLSDSDIKIPSTSSKSHPVSLLPTTSASRICRKKSKSNISDDYVPDYEKYFKRQSNKKIHTSDNTLDSLKNSRLPADRLFALLADMKISDEHGAAINNMMLDYKAYFGKWLFILNEGYNILLYGLGSKRELLQSFHRESLSKQNVLVINGFFPSLTLKEILSSIIKEILEIGQAPANPDEALAIIKDEFSNIPDIHLFIIIHNLDGPMLKNTKAQTILSTLANVPNIHILASIDNINTPLLWDHNKLQLYNFSWWDCTTMLPYTEETAFENSLLVQNSGELALSSMRSVFLSLTSNSRGIYMIIVKYQLKHKGVHNYQGMTFRDLYASCREAFLVSSDLALRAQLTEFLDHKLVKSKRGFDGSELLNIPIANELLQQFLDEQES